MDSFHNHQAKGWAERTLRHTGGGTRAMRGHCSLVVFSKNLLLQEKLRSLAGGSLPPPRSRAVQAYSPRMRTRGCLGWGSALFPQHDWWVERREPELESSISRCPRHCPRLREAGNRGFPGHLQLGMQLSG